MMKDINILASFESIIDIDMGLMRLIKRDYNTNFFYQFLLENSEDNQHVILNRRTNPNLLRAISDDKTEEQQFALDDLYNQFMKDEYFNILKLSPVSTFYRIILSNVFKNNIFKVSVVCKTQEEADILQEKGVECTPIIVDKKDKIYLKKYDVISVKNVFELDEYFNVNGKIIFIPDYRFNVMEIPQDKELLLPEEILIKYGINNQLNIYNAYVYEDGYQLNMEDDLNERTESEPVE